MDYCNQLGLFTTCVIVCAVERSTCVYGRLKSEGDRILMQMNNIFLVFRHHRIAYVALAAGGKQNALL